MRTSGAVKGYALMLASAGAPLVWLSLAAPSALAAAPPAEGAARFTALTKDYCVKCHNTEDWAGGVAMDTLDLAHTGQDPAIWEQAVNKLRGRLMPPAGQKQPNQADVDAFVGFLETSLDASEKNARVGHVPIERLSRTEFAASIRSLIGVDIDAKKALPTESAVDGFTNIASALAVSPAFMEQYLSTVRHAVVLAVGQPVPKQFKTTIPVTPVTAADFPLGTRGGTGRGGLAFDFVFPADAEYRFSIPAEDYLGMGLNPTGAQYESTMVIIVDGVEVARNVLGGPKYLDVLDRDGPTGAKEVLAMSATSAKISAGAHKVAVTFIDRSHALSNDATGSGFGGGFGGGGGLSTMPGIQTAIVVEGPISPSGLSMNASREKIYVCQPKSAAEERPCAEQIARHLGAQAFRRPITSADLKVLMPFYESGRAEAGGFDAGVTELVTAILSSPDFLYRAIPASTKPNDSRLLTDLELATRLSFLMWNTGPDQQLIDLATAKKLSDPKVMEAQVARMLKDPRAESLVSNFALAWFGLDLDSVEPTDSRPDANAALRANLNTELHLFLSSVLLEDRSVVDLLTGDWTFVNADLAQRYGIRGVRGSQFRRVPLTDPNRYGVLGKGAVLMGTSFGDRTSPVRRGQWVLDKIMGTPPAPPPPNVNTDITVKEGEPVTTVRARLELHRTNPTCKACHGLIDPPGLALENFDNTGRWRDYDQAAKAPIDATTELTSGATLTGPVDLRNYLLSHPDQFPTTVTRRLMTYALNRGLEYYDMPQVRQIVREAARNNYRFTAIINGIVNSDAFRRQGAEEQPKKTIASTVSSGAAAAPQP